MYYRILIALIALSATINYIGALEPWMAASAGVSEQSAARKMVQTPAQQIASKTQEMKQIDTQLKTASGAQRAALTDRKQKLQKEIATLKSAEKVHLPTE